MKSHKTATGITSHHRPPTTPHSSNNWALALKHNSILGKTNVSGRIQGPPNALYILSQWLSHPAQDSSVARTLGISPHFPKEEPTTAKEPPSFLNRDHLLSGPWVNVHPGPRGPLHKRRLKSIPGLPIPLKPDRCLPPPSKWVSPTKMEYWDSSSNSSFPK